jgi:hypothetical protein
MSKNKGFNDLLKAAKKAAQDATKKRGQTAPDQLPTDPESGTAAYTTLDPESGIDSGERRLINILLFMLLLGMGYFILSNILPYMGIVDRLFFQWQQTELFQWIARLWVVGWFVTGGLTLTKFLLGGSLWGILQILELLPTVINNSPIFILQTLNFLNQFKTIKLSDKDSPIARRLKQRYNAIPGEHIEKANIARAIAYLLDGAICLAYYQPIEGGWKNLEIVFLGGWDYVQWEQIFYILTTLFAIEVIYWIYRFADGLLKTYFANN